MCDNLISPLYQKSVPLTVVPAGLSRNLSNFTNTCFYQDDNNREIEIDDDSSSSSSDSSSSSGCSSSSSNSSLPPQEIPPPEFNNTLQTSFFANIPDLLTIPTDTISGAYFTDDNYYAGSYTTNNRPSSLQAFSFSPNCKAFNITNLEMNKIDLIYKINCNYNIFKDPTTGLFYIKFKSLKNDNYMTYNIRTKNNDSQVGDPSIRCLRLLSISSIYNTNTYVQDSTLLEKLDGNDPLVQVLSGSKVEGNICIRTHFPQLSYYRSNFKIDLKTKKDKCSPCSTTYATLSGEDYKCNTLTFNKVPDCNTPTNNPDTIKFKVKTSVRKNDVDLLLTFLPNTGYINLLFTELYERCTNVEAYNSNSRNYFTNEQLTGDNTGKYKVKIRIPLEIIKHKNNFRLFTKTIVYLTTGHNNLIEGGRRNEVGSDEDI